MATICTSSSNKLALSSHAQLIQMQENLYIVPVICHSSVERHRVFQTLMLNYLHRVAVFSWDMYKSGVCVTDPLVISC